MAPPTTVVLKVTDGQFHLTDARTRVPLLYSAGTNGLVGVLGEGAACVCASTLHSFVRLTV